MAHVEGSVVIARDIAEVFAFTDDPAHEPVWRSTTVDATFTSDGPPGVGSTGRETSRFLGREDQLEWEITEYEPNERVAYTVMAKGEPGAASTAYVYESVPEGTRFTIVFDAPDGGGAFGRLPDALTRRLRSSLRWRPRSPRRPTHRGPSSTTSPLTESHTWRTSR